jgi:4a-hydroxytetrahydrobiopterin dehydratase
VATRISEEEFRRSEGTAGWRVTADTAEASFQTKSFATGVALIDEIGALADAMNHHPDVDLRYAVVTVRLTTHDVGGLSELDAELARRISDAATAMGLAVDAG